jgi:hypothetical protein
MKGEKKMAYPGLMNKMICREDFERMEKGLPPRPKQKVIIPEPEPPVIENQIFLKDFQKKEIVNVDGHARAVKNKDGVRFTGFDLMITFQDKAVISGWLSDGDFQRMKALTRGSKIDTGLNRILG